MSKSPAFQCYPKDLLVDTALLSAEEFGIYWRLCCYAWKGVGGVPQCALPNNNKQLSRMAGVSRQKWQTVRETVLEYFELKDDLWWHPRLVKEMEKQQERAKKLSEAGRKGALARHGQATSQATSDDGGQATSEANGPAMARPPQKSRPGHSLIRPSLPSPSTTTTPVTTTPSPPPPSPRREDVEKSGSQAAGPVPRRIRNAILAHLHRPAGAESVKVNGSTVGLGLELKIAKRMLSNGLDPGELELAIQHVREAEGVPEAEPLTMRYLEAQPAALNRAIGLGHKRQSAPGGVVGG